jgi:hypothetical protein
MTLPAVVKARGPQTARFSPAVVQVCQSPWHEDSLVVERSMSVTRELPHSRRVAHSIAFCVTGHVLWIEWGRDAVCRGAPS